MALTLRLTLRSHCHQTVVLREISTHPRSGERGYIKVSAIGLATAATADFEFRHSIEIRREQGR